MRLLPVLALLAACASAPVRPSVEAEDLKELRSQLQAQSALVAQQQRRIEELEVKLAALAARAQPAHAPTAAPARSEPRPPLKTVKVGGRVRRSDRGNPVEHAPRIPATVELRDPDPEALARLETDVAVA